VGSHPDENLTFEQVIDRVPGGVMENGDLNMVVAPSPLFGLDCVTDPMYMCPSPIQPMSFDEYWEWFSSEFHTPTLAKINTCRLGDELETAGIKASSNVHYEEYNRLLGKQVEEGSSEDRCALLGNGMLHIKAPNLVPQPDSIDTVQFDNVEYIIYEEETHVTCCVYRRGDPKSELTFSWRTVKGKREPSDIYVEQSGTEVMKPGQHKVGFRIEFHKSDHWDLMLREFVQIETVTSANQERRCGIGEVWECCFVILNNDPFPEGLDPAKVDDETGACLPPSQPTLERVSGLTRSILPSPLSRLSW